jgi:hypothetical protein
MRAWSSARRASRTSSERGAKTRRCQSGGATHDACSVRRRLAWRRQASPPRVRIPHDTRPRIFDSVHHSGTENRDAESFARNPPQHRPQPRSLFNTPDASSTEYYDHAPATHAICCGYTATPAAIATGAFSHASPHPSSSPSEPAPRVEFEPGPFRLPLDVRRLVHSRVPPAPRDSAPLLRSAAATSPAAAAASPPPGRLRARPPRA